MTVPKHDLAKQMTSSVVNEVAPEEALFIDDVMDIPTGKGEGGRILGFGAEASVLLIAPMVAAFFTSFFKTLGDQTGKTLYRSVSNLFAKDVPEDMDLSDYQEVVREIEPHFAGVSQKKKDEIIKEIIRSIDRNKADLFDA